MIVAYQYDNTYQVATDAAATITVPFQSKLFYVKAWNNNLRFSLSYDGTRFGDEIILDFNDPPWPIPYCTRALRVRNATPGLASTYQLTPMG